MNEVISVIGAGYVGLTTAAILSNAGYKTYLIDVDQNKIDIIKSKRSHFYEPGLDSFIDRGITIGNLIPTTSYQDSIPNSTIAFICVGTPNDEDGNFDLSYVFDCATAVVTNAADDLILVQKSTVPVETGKKIKNIIKENNTKNFKIDLISCPEFLKESSAVFDTLFFDRLILSNETPESSDRIIDLYRNIDSLSKIVDSKKLTDYAFLNKAPKDTNLLPPFEKRILRVSSIESAELIKVTANSFLAMKISFANTVARLCDKVGADSVDVMNGVGSDDRINRSFLYPGLGFSGGCFPKDVSGMISISNEHNVRFGILEEVIHVNSGQINIAIDKIQRLIGEDLTDKTIAVLGLSFKPGTSDVRKSQSLRLIKRLLNLNAKVKAFDPKAIEESKKKVSSKNLFYTDSIEVACENVDCIVVATEWHEFTNFDFTKSNCRNIVDCRNCLDKKKIKEAGFNYLGF